MSGLGPSKTIFLKNVNHIGPKLALRPTSFFYRRRILIRRAELVDDNKQIHSWALSPNAVLPMDGHISCVPMGSLGHRCFTDVSDDDFEEA